MSKSLLTVIQTDETTQVKLSPSKQRQNKLQAYWEREWLKNPKKYDPTLNALGRSRIQRALEILSIFNLDPSTQILDLGCGYASLSKNFPSVTLVDIASNALKDSPLKTIQAGLPNTALPDSSYDLILCTEVIAELDSKDYRLAFSELSRLLKPNGKILISTPIDIDSKDALEKFLWFVGTEFEIIEHLYVKQELFIRLLRLCKRLPIYRCVKNSDFLLKFLSGFGLSHATVFCQKRILNA